MAAKQILSLVVASTWVVNLLIDNQTKEPKAYAFGSFFVIVFRLVRDVVANHKTTRYAGAATKVIQKNHLA